jgi:hypothetical protein
MRVPNRKINQINISKLFFGEQKAEKTTQITVVSDLDCYKTYWFLLSFGQLSSRT